jgi:Fuc2NAc and GlcNAc transferase
LQTTIAVVGAFTLAMSVVLTGFVRRFALSLGLVDVPNERSSHSRPTPRAGGLSIVIATVIALFALHWLDLLETNVLLALSGGGVAVAVVGFWDDRYGISARVRIVVHLIAAVWGIACVGSLQVIQIGNQVVHLGPAGDVLSILGIVWALNLFNFMDGIDAIAASEAVFVVSGGGALLSFAHRSSGVVPATWMFASAFAGFLPWNWPPAKIFMGDVGSGYIGYAIGVLALASTRENPASVWMWLILGGVFFVDATATLVRRSARGERVYQPHRSHAYQQLARLWGSHRRVTLAVIILNMVWLLPCALLATLYPSHAAWIAAGALVPVLLVVTAAGAGRH